MHKTRVISGEKGEVIWEGILPIVPRIGESFFVQALDAKLEKLNSGQLDEYGMKIENIVYDIQLDNSLVIEIFI